MKLTWLKVLKPDFRIRSSWIGILSNKKIGQRLARFHQINIDKL